MAVPDVTPALLKVGDAGREMRTMVGVVAPLLAAMRPPGPRRPSEASRLVGKVEVRFFDLVVRRGKTDGKVEESARATRRTGQPMTPTMPVLPRLRDPAREPRPAEPLEPLLSSELPSELKPNSASMVGL